MADKAFFLLHVNDHAQYLHKIQATLEDKGDFQGTDYRGCKLGIWLYGNGPKEAAALGPEAKALFEGLLEPHRRFHEVSRHAVERKQAADIEGAKAAITEMHRLSAVMVDKLLALDHIAR
jgi:hypothetical protein